MLELKVGDHLGDQPASYTRFVLPFRYHLENLPEEAVYDAVYRPHDVPHRMWRERYLTVELLIFAVIVAVFFIGTIHIVRRSPQIAKALESISSEEEKPGLWKAKMSSRLFFK